MYDFEKVFGMVREVIYSFISVNDKYMKIICNSLILRGITHLYFSISYFLQKMEFCHVLEEKNYIRKMI